MRITDVEAIPLYLGTEKAIADGTQDALIIKVYTDENIIGIGEADTSPHVGKAIIDAPVSGDKCQGIRNIIVGEDPFDVEVIWEKMYYKTYKFGRKGAAINVMSGIDIALWDIIGKKLNQPIYKLLGGAFRKEVVPYASVLFPQDPGDINDVKEKANKCINAGFRSIKFGWGGFGDLEEKDYALIEAIRDEAGNDEVRLMIDVGMKWDAKTAIQRAGILKEFRPYWFEEPVIADDLHGYSEISAAVNWSNIVGGEQEYTRYGFKDLMDIGRVDMIQPDLARAGGFTECRKVAAMAHTRNIPCIPHGWSTDILVKANLHFIAATRNAYFLEYCMMDSPLRWEVTINPSQLEDGVVKVPEEPGLGVHLNEETLRKYSG